MVVSNEDARTASLPMIDFVSWTTDASREQRMKAAQDLVEGCRRAGFVYITNHGIPEAMIEQAFAWAKKFFDLPVEDKMKTERNGLAFRGYNPTGVQKVPRTLQIRGGDPTVKGHSPDYNETFDFGSDDNHEQPNKWLPDDLLPGFHNFCNDFNAECWKATQRILRALALGLGMSENAIEKFHSSKWPQSSFKHYPAVRSSDFDTHEKERLGAHSDMTSLTLLFNDDCPGLEVEAVGEPGTFFSANPIKGTLIMNVGDVLMRWTNDMLLSTIHRVQPPPRQEHEEMTRERYSIPYFVSPARDVVIECLPGCLEGGAKYAPRLYKELTEDYSKLFRSEMAT